MIVGVPKTWWRMLLTLRGSTLPSIWVRLVGTVALSVVVTVFWEAFDLDRFTLTATPFALIGVALGIFLGFRNNASYDRFWEGRKLWGRLVNTSRTWARQLQVYVQPPPEADAEARAAVAALQRRLTYRQMGYVHALRMHLRDGGRVEELEPFLDPGEAEALRGQHNRPAAIAHRTGLHLRDAYQRGWIHPQHLPALEQSLVELLDIQGGCERIKATPVPWIYNVLIHRIVFVYCVGLPFGLHESVQALTPVVVAMIAYAFYGLDAIGDEIEEPFGADANDLPLSQLSRMIEVNLRQALDEQELPPLVQPERGLLR